MSLTEPQDQNSEVYTTLSIDQNNPTILKSIDDYSETNANDKTTIYYGFYITPDTPKGTYEGSNITYTAITNPPVATVTFDGNGLYFNDDEEQTTNTVKYMPDLPTSQTVAYSHTPNVNDEGAQTPGEMYPIGLNKTFVYKFENATEVKLHLVKMEPDGTCGPNSDQYFSFWEGSHPDYTAKNNWGSGVKVSGSDGKYPFYSSQYVGMDATVQGDTLTFAYTTSDHRGGSCGNSGYGYYATITATDADGNNVLLVGNNPVMGNYTVPSTETTHKFLGWSTDKNALIGDYTSAKDFTNYVFNSPDEKVTVYAIWDPIIEITYNGNGADDTTDMNNVSQYTTDFTTAGRTVDLLASNYQRAGYGFIGWSEDKDAYTKLTNGEDVTIYGPNETLTIGREMQQRMSQTGKLELNAIWAEVAKDSQGNDLTFQTDDLLTKQLSDTEGDTLATKPNGYVTALKDSRDNEVYAVAKLADGNYWMIENLRLDNTHELSLQNTNNPSLPLTNDYNAGTTSNFLSATSNSWCTDYDSTPCYNQSKLNTNNVAATTTSPAFSQNYTNGTHASDFNTNLYSYGNYYNWYSATAGRGTRETSGNQVVAGDICPAGWQLPYGGSGDTNNGKGNTSGGFYYLNNLLGNSSNAWRSFPNNFIYSGNWNNSSPSSRGNYGYYWASTTSGTSSAYNLYFYNSYVGSTSSNSKYYGSSVRCVAPIQTTITFDGNGSTSGEMAKQKIGANSAAPLNQNTFTKNDYAFASWNTERDGSGTSYADRQDFTAGEGINNVTLYAQWADCVPNKICYKSNGANSPTTMDPQSASSSTDVELWASNYKYDTNNDGHNDYGFAGWSEDKDAAAKLVDNNSTNNPVVYGPNQTITTGDLSLEGMKLYAVWIAPEQNTSFQDFSCPNNTDMPIGTVIALRDNRDNEVYTVAKLADGNCWMTENLRLDNNATINATNTNSPISTFTALSPSSNSWCEDNSESCINQSMLNTNNIAKSVSPMTGTDANIYSYGNYYNWYSATAGNGTYSTGWNVTVTGDLCPAGWHLPYGGNETSAKGGNTSGGFYYLNQQMGGVTSTQGSKNWRSFPNNFVYSGGWYGSSAGYRGRYGYYRSSTALSTGYAYHLNFGSDYVDQGTSGNRMSYAYSVRCVAPVE